MPLVSGVCRTASAPMLSHGGSRLNASKPEANPKTRYPPTTTHFFLNIYNTAFRRGLFLCFSLQGGKWRSDADCGNLAKIGKTSLALSQGRREGGYTHRVSLSSSSSSLFLPFREFSEKRFSIESPLKPLPPARPLVAPSIFMITRIYNSIRFSHSLRFPDKCFSARRTIQSGDGNTTHTFYLNVPLQTREHALAGISGMLRSSAEAQGAFTSRGAKPYGLNLML